MFISIILYIVVINFLKDGGLSMKVKKLLKK